MRPVRQGLAWVISAGSLKKGLAASAAIVTAIAITAGPAAATTTTVKAEADAHVSSATPTTNLGKQRRLRVDALPLERTYLRFRLDGLTSEVTGATLRLFSQNSSGTGIRVHGVAANDWDERTITDADAPELGPVASSSTPLTAGQWAAIDVTSLVTGNGPVSLALTTTSKNVKRFSSREVVAQAPELVVTTADLPPPDADPVIAAAGDIACHAADPSYNGGLGTAVACRHRYTSDLLVTADLDAVLPLGDLQYENGVLADFQEVFDPTWGRVKSLLRPVPGNHEYHTAGAAGYFDYFNGPGNQTGVAGDRAAGYYGYGLGDWHLVALNSNCPEAGGCGPGSPQEQWLRADLAAHPGSCTLAYWHHPYFSSGMHGPSPAMRPIWQALYEAGADVVLTAHDHDYERFAPQDADGVADPAAGIREFVVGTGGASRRPILAVAPNSGARNTEAYGVLELTLRPDGYDWQFVPEVGGTFTDAGTDVCDGSFADSSPPSVPVALGGTAISDHEVSLTWTASTDNDGVSGYTVLRDGTPVGTSTTASFTDATAESERTYEYRVTASDPAGNASEASEPATVSTPGLERLLAFGPTDDSHVRLDMPGANFGSLSTIQVDNSPVKEALLNFAVSGIGSSRVVEARLRLFAADGSGLGGIFAPAGEPAWTEGTVTWDTAPAAGSPVASLGRVAAGQWYEVDVTPLVTGDGPVDLRITSTSSDGADYSSKEGAAGRAPQLLVTVEGGAP